MTDMPAKTPKPIGRTSIFLPGRVKGVEDAEAAFSAAAVPAWSAGKDVLVAPEIAPADVVGLGDEASATGTEDAEAEVVDVDDTVPDENDTVTDVVGRTEIGATVLKDESSETEEVIAGRDAVGVPDTIALESPPDTATEHCLTSTTCSLPFASVMGVKVIVQVSVASPSGVSVEVTVCTVWGPVKAASCRRTRARTLPASLWA